jgi:RNase P subunit RPR2
MEKKRNLWVLPTDKPSRFSLNSSGKYHLTNQLYTNSPNFTNQNIYITSDEEIKEGDWWLNLKTNDVDKCTHKSEVLLYNSEKYQHIKKIILTTDQDLIKDGVQAIDDEFLQWFVKNPTCEYVEVKKVEHLTNKPYRVTIPKEEPKQCKTPLDCGKIYNEELTTQTVTCSKCGNTHTFPFGGDYYCPSFKQETLEEAKKKFAYTHKKEGDTAYEFGRDMYSFDKGAEWQAKRSYSEEDMKQFGLYLGDNLKKLKGKSIDEIFEQFKKK